MLRGRGPLVPTAEVPVDDVGAPHVAQVVDVELGIHEAEPGVADPASLLLVEPVAAAEAGERCGVRVHLDVGGVRPLEVVQVVGLDVRDLRRRAVDVRHRRPAGDHPGLPAIEEGPAVGRQNVRLRVELALERAVLE